jgi:hypothetical protein
LGSGLDYPLNIDPGDVVAFFTEWREGHGPVGTTKLHLQHPYLSDQVFAREGIDEVRRRLGIDLVLVTWRPDWTPYTSKPSQEKKAPHRPVWVNPKHVDGIGQSNIFSQEKRKSLGAVYLSDGFVIDNTLETWPEIQERFAPYQIPYRHWRRNGR